MRNYSFVFHFTVACVALFSSCSTLDKVAKHGFTSGYYKVDLKKEAKDVYVDVSDEEISVYPQSDRKVDKEKYLSIPLKTADSVQTTPLTFRKKSLDIDITSVLLKYRPSVNGLPQQLTADLNMAMYAGMRFDSYKITDRVDPLGKHSPKITNLGYDFGIFAGPGISPINPFTTNNRTNNDYSGMIFQMGVAGFLESSIASFGIAVGFDYLLNRDRAIWIYNKKPWLGFVVGIALN